MTKEERRLRNKIVQKGRTEMNRQIRKGVYIELKKKYGFMDTEELVDNKKFLDDIIREFKNKQTKKFLGG